jgi:DNA helicase HerA-like ATPase
VTFESGSRLEGIEESVFQESRLKSIEIPSSVLVLGMGSFWECKALESVTFESGSRLERIEESAFSESGLRSIEIPASVAFVDRSAFLATPLARQRQREEEARKAQEIEEAAREGQEEELNAQNR